ncbi:uncharacterized protein LOC116176690 [Photinus pyralis]|nr:uncharacterized protein LOC116176690 [Photinus pyralis]
MYRTVYFFCLFFTLLCGGVFANICDVCDCQSAGGRVFSITCDCIATQDLHLTSSMMMKVESTNMVIIRNCQTVSIERNSFAQLDKLDTLGIQNCLRVYLATGAFSKINSLLINNVQNLSFGEMSFMGARGIKNIIINSSNITEMPHFSFYDVQGLDRFTLFNVNIDTIRTNAINISANTVGIESAEIHNIETDGIAVDATKVYIQDSEFGQQNYRSVKVKTKYQTRLLNNKFSGLFRIEITSPFVEFSKNRFESLHSSTFSTITLSRMMSNTITNGDLQNIFPLFSHKDFHSNQFYCSCQQGNLLNVTKNSPNYEILKENFCISNCSVSVFEYEVESAAKCMKDRVLEANSFCTEDRWLSKNVSSTTPREDKNRVLPPTLLQPRFLLDESPEVPVHSGSEKNILNSLAIMVGLSLMLRF